MNNSTAHIYLDYNATMPVPNVVRDAVVECMSYPYNASSVHVFGREAKRILEEARRKVKNLANIASDKYEVIFTSTGTEANNMALRALPQCKVITTGIEHASILKLVNKGVIPVDSNGIVDLVALENLLQALREPLLVSVIHANNEVGVIQSIAEIAEIVHKYHGYLHIDSVQAFGKIPVNVERLDADLVTLSGHKYGAPLGAAALIFKRSLDIAPLMVGGGQEKYLRPGTHNLPAIHGLGIASEIALDMPKKYLHIEQLRNYMEEKIKIICSDVIIFAEKAVQRLPNTSAIAMPNVSNDVQLIYFDTHGIAVSAGSACSSGRVNFPYVQVAMGYDENIARQSIRVSLGVDTTKQEVDSFVNEWKNLYLQHNSKV